MTRMTLLSGVALVRSVCSEVTGMVTAAASSPSKAEPVVAIVISSPGRRCWVVILTPFTRVPLLLPRSVRTKPSASCRSSAWMPGDRRVGV